MTARHILTLAGVLLLCCILSSVSSQSWTNLDTQLTSWSIYSSAEITASGAKISQVAFDASNWYPVTIPATVMAGLIANAPEGSPMADIYYSTNIENVSMAQFTVPWWYRTVFPLSNVGGGNVTITFRGINYRADVWLNGQQIASNTDVAMSGAFVYHTFVLPADLINENGDNCIAVLIWQPDDTVFPPNNNTTDLAITFVDWAPTPPDFNMGIWQTVDLAVTGPVTVQWPAVETTLYKDNSDDINDEHYIAYLRIHAELMNYLSDSTSVTLSVDIPELNISFSNDVFVAPGQNSIRIDKDDFASLEVHDPPLWWPYQMGNPTLLTLNLTVSVSGVVYDNLVDQFGIREMKSELDNQNNRLYLVNKKPVLIRGGGWSPDLFLRPNFSTPDGSALQKHFDYVIDIGLNAIRLEGKMESEEWFDMADRLGILTLPGWCCCDAWQHWPAWTTDTMEIASNSAISQGYRLKIHASILVFLYSSDELPPPDVEQLYLNAFEEVDWFNPLLASASARNSTITGWTGVKMSGPYSWVPPNYWLLDNGTYNLGGAWGFLTEGGPGENPMTMDSFKMTVPADEIWPMSFDWDYHCGNQEGHFGDLSRFTPVVDARYGNSYSAQEFLMKSQVAAYEGHRAMFEGYARNKYLSTGMIQWMLNNAWPEMIWHLYDYYWQQGGAYYGTKHACLPLHIIYSYNDASIWVINSKYQKAVGPFVAVAEVLNIDGQIISVKNKTIKEVPADKSMPLFYLPDVNNIPGISETYFVRLTFLNQTQQNNPIDTNFYWLSLQPDVLEWDNSTWYNTPVTTYADLTLLQSIQPVDLQLQHSFSASGVNTIVTINVNNPANSLAFFIRLIVQENGNEVMPAFYSDNYFTLLPYQSQIFTAVFPTSLISNYDDVEVIATQWANVVNTTSSFQRN